MTGLLVVGAVMFVIMLCIGLAVANEERKKLDAIYDYDPMLKDYGRLRYAEHEKRRNKEIKK